MLKKALYFLLLFSISSYAHQDEMSSHFKVEMKSDLESIKKRKYIRFLTTKNHFDYNVRDGKVNGLQFERAKILIDKLNKKYVKKGELKFQFEFIPVDHDLLIPLLQKGYGDIIAAPLTITNSRKKQLLFSTPYREAKEVIVHNKKTRFIEGGSNLFSVRKSSSYFETINELKRSDILIGEVNGEIISTEIAELISKDILQFTLIDDYLAIPLAKKYPNLALSDELSIPKRQIAWATLPQNKNLMNEVNQALFKIRKGSLLGNFLPIKYLNNLELFNSIDTESNKISIFDETIKTYSNEYNFDWRLMSALCYQESRFNPKKISHKGAVGLFQVLPKTAKENYINIFPITGPDNYKNNIHAGIKYLKWIQESFFERDELIERKDKLRFSLAAYNSGIGTLKRARKKASTMGLDPNKWYRNVEIAMLKMHYHETVYFVYEINKRYNAYVLMGY